MSNLTLQQTITWHRGIPHPDRHPNGEYLCWNEDWSDVVVLALSWVQDGEDWHYFWTPITNSFYHEYDDIPLYEMDEEMPIHFARIPKSPKE